MAAVEFIHVTKSCDGVVTVNDLSFAIEPGQVFGLLGPNGAGKTSTLRMMMGAIARKDQSARFAPGKLAHPCARAKPSDPGLYHARLAVLEQKR